MNPLGELALKRTPRGAACLERMAIDEVGDGLGLNQIDAAVEKGALREFTGSRHTGPELENTRQELVEDNLSAVTLQFEDILARK